MRPRSSRFSPRLLDPEVIERLTVGREQLVARMVENLSAAILAGHGRYDLVVGPRGVGKSHLLGLVEHRVRASEALNERLVVVSLAEEFSPSSLLHLLATVLREMPADTDAPPVDAQLSVLRAADKREAEGLAVSMIRARLDGRSLLVMLENLDALFEDLGRKPQARLRKILQTEGTWSLFATARSAEGFTRQDAPFHATFVVERLPLLDPRQCRDQLVELARLHEQPILEGWLCDDPGLTQVRAVALLLGGNPRVMAMIFHHLDPEHLDDLHDNFHRLAEEVTPYFQEQMSQLSAGQRPVMEFLAERWSPTSVSEIANGTFCDPTTISTHLRALRRDGLVQALTVGRERFYEIADPLHRVARAMKCDERLGQALAMMTRVWAMLSVDSDATPRFSSPFSGLVAEDSEYVSRLHKELFDRLLSPDVEVETLIDELLSRSRSPMSMVIGLPCLMKLGRIDEALETLRNLTRNFTPILGEVLLIAPYVLWLISPEPHEPSVAQEQLAAMFDRSVHGLPAQSVDFSALIQHLGAGNKVRFLTRVLLHHGPRAIALIDQHCGESSSADDRARLALAAWVHQQLPALADELLEPEHPPLQFYLGALHPKRWTDLTTFQVLVHAHILFERVAENLASLGERARPNSSTAPLFLSVIPLWLASGRQLGVVEPTLQALIGTPLPEEIRPVLGAPDHTRAFARLPRQQRTFARDVLQLIGADEVLAALPSEPS